MIRRSERIAAAAGVAAAALLLSFRGFYEPDLWWHLAQGRQNLTGRIVRTNLFSFTFPEYPQHFTSWLFDTAACLTWTAAGGAGIQMLQAGLIALALALVYRASRVGGVPAAAAAVLILGFFVIEPRAIPRPHLVSFAGMAAISLLLQQATSRRSASPLYLAVPAIAVWSNFHAEAVFGVLLVGVFAAAELVRPAALITRAEAWRAVRIAVLCGVATLATPYGWGLVRYLYENWTMTATLDIAELRPPYLPAYRAFYVYLAIAGLLFLSQPRILRLWEGLAFVLFAALGLRYLRLTPLVFFATAPMLTARIGALIARGIDPRAVAITALAAGLAVSRLPPRALISELRSGTEAIEPRGFFSPDAIAFVQANGLEGPVFNSNNLGGYLAWHLYPGTRIFQDGRMQAYPPGFMDTVITASRSQERWDGLVAGADWAVLSVPRPNELSGAGQFPSDRWVSVFRDQAIEVLVRRNRTKQQQAPRGR